MTWGCCNLLQFVEIFSPENPKYVKGDIDVVNIALSDRLKSASRSENGLIEIEMLAADSIF